MRRLNGIDALMLYLDGGSAYNHTLKISVLDPSTDPDGWSCPKARRMFEERVHLLPVFRLRYLPTPLGLHHPIWVEDPEFDLDAHVRRVVCPAPGGMEEFCALVEQIYAHPLDRDRPLWQTWVVEGLEGGRVALVTLLHHAYTDGVGVLDMLGRVLQRHAGRRARRSGAVGTAAAAVGKAAAGLGTTRPALQTRSGCADGAGHARPGAHRARLRQGRRARASRLPSTAPHRRARSSAGCRAAGGSPARPSRSPTFAR